MSSRLAVAIPQKPPPMMITSNSSVALNAIKRCPSRKLQRPEGNMCAMSKTAKTRVGVARSVI
ncbi:hypothetical protein [Salinisphaera sp. Q1T1-3]|uniref:hypothetical protein n=1 Tax=Salinisphaera sp. Q1T1-3 TaxID=2321229 RepID=UPI0018F659A9|nr:hypothetical protein [Salinisphaera sp. Q1T1-3]